MEPGTRNRLSLPGLPRENILIRAGQPPHGEFDSAVRQFAPTFHRTHVGGLGVAVEEIARLGPRRLARQRKGLAQIAVCQLSVGHAPPGHPAGEIPRAKRHVETPKRDHDRLNIVPAEPIRESSWGSLGWWRSPDAAQRGISAFTRVFDALWRCRAG